MENKANCVQRINSLNLLYTQAIKNQIPEMKKNLKKWSLNILELYCLTFRQKAKHALILDHSESLIYKH